MKSKKDEWLNKEFDNKYLSRRTGVLLLIVDGMETKLNGLIKTIIEKGILEEKDIRENIKKIAIKKAKQKL